MTLPKPKVLILGGSGMLGHVLFRWLTRHSAYEVYATARSREGLAFLPPQMMERVRVGVDADNFDTIIRALASIQPDIVINCIGLIKQLPLASDPLSGITVNAQLPHRISLVCRTANARMIHISTDCVFDGKKGNYQEADVPNPQDLYGQTKFLGEVTYPHCITLRTSIIGHELKGRFGLVEWFLRQKKKTKGFTKAVFSGVPTIELARVISDFVLPHKQLSGLYQVSSQPISKYDLVRMIAEKYGKKIEIEPSDDVVIDRSLDSSLFQRKIGYRPPPWPELIEMMHSDYMKAQEEFRCYL